jgi:EAL and modified HD-GYP domain-containing signal transduction protein
LWRAKACENIARAYQRANPSSYYAVGMLSLLDAMTGAPMDVVLKDLSVNDEIRACLLGEPNHLREVLDVVLRLEQDPTPGTDATADVPEVVLDAYQRAMVWANGLASTV